MLKEYHTTHLKPLIGFIEQNKDKIANSWIREKKIRNVFKVRKISIDKFREKYAVDIVDYFIDVVLEKQKIGDCPAMSKLVGYLAKKNITPREVFEICMGLRRSLIQIAFENEITLQHPHVVVDEINQIFDANLAGVLENFTAIYAAHEKNSEIAKLQKYKLQQTIEIINLIDTKLMVVQKGRIVLANKPLLDIVGVKNLQELYLKYEDGFSFLNEIDIYEDEFKNNIKKWIDKSSKTANGFRASIYSAVDKKRHYFIGKTVKMPLENTQYIITLSDITQEVKKEQKLQKSITHDEVSGFINFVTFEKLLEKFIQKAKKDNNRLFLAVVDIHALKELPQEKAKNVLHQVSNDMRSLMDKHTHFARVDDEQLAILMDYQSEQKAYNWCVSFLKKIKKDKPKKSIAVSEVDLSENINATLLRIYKMAQSCFEFDDIYVETDLRDVIKYVKLPKQEQFVLKLKETKKVKTTVFYKNLPISFESKLCGSSVSNVRLSFSQKQMNALHVGGSVYFSLPVIGNIKTSVKQIDHNSQEVTLGDFRFDKHSPLQREKIRVEVCDDIVSHINHNSKEFEVKILDANSECIALWIDRRMDFELNSSVYIDMLLPISSNLKPCGADATITRIESLKEGYKMVLLCHFDIKNEDLMSKYISECQTKILKEFQNKIL